MLLRPNTTCDQAIKILEGMVWDGVNDVQTAVPYLSPVPDLGELNQFAAEKSVQFEQAVRKYDQWVATATEQLTAVFADRSIAERLRGERYSHIVHTKSDRNTVRHVLVLLNTELNDLRSYFTGLANQLREMKERYKHHAGKTLVLDTNDLLHYARFDTIPWARIFGADTVVVIPHVVVDEIDKKSYATQDNGVRRRVRGVFELLETTLTVIEDEGRFQLGDGTVVEVMTDEPGHVRLPNNDDEIVARACALHQAIAPIQVTVITGDNGMRARALAWGLKARKLDEKYKIERLTAAQKKENLDSITVELPAEDETPTPSAG